jgi:hypothetical protein
MPVVDKRAVFVPYVGTCGRHLTQWLLHGLVESHAAIDVVEVRGQGWLVDLEVLLFVLLMTDHLLRCLLQSRCQSDRPDFFIVILQELILFLEPLHELGLDTRLHLVKTEGFCSRESHEKLGATLELWGVMNQQLLLEFTLCFVKLTLLTHVLTSLLLVTQFKIIFRLLKVLVARFFFNIRLSLPFGLTFVLETSFILLVLSLQNMYDVLFLALILRLW